MAGIRYKKNEYVMLQVPLRIEQVEKLLPLGAFEDREQQLVVRMVGRKFNLMLTTSEVRPATQAELNAVGIPARSTADSGKERK
jgi:hypothetical protein